ncbi:spondin domain-containing protein [Alteromonas flava]|uniref:spondin domain-containing protein n=1 Tax=Alteromonas flava TaxID=2048003 RepID=UPI000C28F8C6|nr:spondin domain-containing protein [Alteromonas flava]
MISNPIKRQLLLATVVSVALSGCGSDSDDLPPPSPPPEPPPPAPVMVSYEVTLTNLTNAQPFSPAAIILHAEGQLFAVGEPASQAIEVMAEGGDNSQLIALDIALSAVSGVAPIGPGNNETITVTVEDTTDALLSITTMLVNTNDAFTGLNAISLSELAVGDSWMTTTVAYDAGTEANSEAQGTIPGPVDGGEGYNATRDDVDYVAMHGGVVTGDDGLMDSVLTVQHKFDNPVMRVVVTRIE